MLIAQISDPHLRPRGVLYQGVVDSNALFAAAIRQLNAMRPAPDLVLLTGDLVDEGKDEEYRFAREALETLKYPVLAIPGNHDEREAFRACFADHSHLPRSGPLHFCVADRGPVRIVALDVTVPGQHHGQVDAEAAQWLDGVLASESGRPTIVMMHQPPFLTHVPYLDDYWCREGKRLAEVVGRHAAVERIVCGHVHRFMLLRFGGTVLCTAPSTATAIALRPWPGAEPASYLEPPGFLLHHWTASTGLTTHLVPIGDFEGPFPFA